MTEIAIMVGARIRSLRKSRGWSQEELASICKLHTTYIGQVERGEKSVTIRNLERIVQALETDFSEVFLGMGSRTHKFSDSVSEMITLMQARNSMDQKFILHLVKSLLEWTDSR